MHLLKNGSSIANTDLEENISPPLQPIPPLQQHPLTPPQIQQPLQYQLTPIQQLQQPPLSPIEIRLNVLKLIFINIFGFIVIMSLLFTLGVLVFLLVSSVL
jgi:hypothetical protein